MASVPAHMDGGDPVRLAVENDLETHFETLIRVTLSCWRPLPGAHPPARRAQAKVVSGNERQPRRRGWGEGGSCPPDGTLTGQQNQSEKDTRSRDGARRGRQKAACRVTAVSQPTKCHWVAWCHTCPARRAGGVSHTGGLPLGSRPPGGGTPGGHPVCWLYALS